MDVEFELNGSAVHYEGEPQRRLLQILREDLHLTGAKPGCEVGRCGACMVWLDGQPANACLLMAWQLEGRRVTTIEQVAEDAASAQVRRTLAECGAVQCGYCAAGIVMTMTHLFNQSPRPDVQSVQRDLAANLCRCTGYGGIQRAIDQLFGQGVPEI